MGTPERVAVVGAGVGGPAADLEFGARAAAVMADPHITAPPHEGPTRDDLLASVAAIAIKEGA